jgi:hypothetical protein
MPLLRYFLPVLAMASVASGNLYVPNAKLAGETVYARLTNESARVTAVFEFEEWMTRDAKILYFPIYANDADTPVQALAHSDFELEVGDRKLGVAEPCEAPERFKNISRSPRIYWYSVNLEHVVDFESVDFNSRISIKMTYTQPLIHGKFYYLPVIIAHADLNDKSRPWKYQMFARSNMRVVQVLSKGTDFEQFGDAVSVYLRDGDVVEIR